MTLTSALEATERSLILAGLRATHRVGAVVAPEQTARSIARRFFTTSRPPAAQLEFTGLRPQVGRVAVPDGTVMTYEFGAVGHAPTVLLSHGWNGWAQQMEPFIEPILARGFAVLAFDHVAHGSSEGTTTSLPAMIRTTERLIAVTPHLVSGIAHSLGAAALASALATQRHEMVGAVLIAPPSDPRPYLSGLARMLGAPEAMLPKVQQFADSFAGTPFERLVMRSWRARQIRTPLLIAHDVDDREVPIAHGYAYTGSPRTRIIATHGLGHTRILSDRHIVDSAVNFVTRRRTAHLALAA